MYANRRVYLRLPGDNAPTEHQVKDLITVLSDDAVVEIQYPKANGETVYLADISLKINNLPQQGNIIAAILYDAAKGIYREFNEPFSKALGDTSV